MSELAKQSWASPDQAVADYALWIKRVALHIHSTMPWSEVDDLVQWGTVGLLEARERFDPSRGKPFAAFANRRIRGAMIDSLRREGVQSRYANQPGTAVADSTLGRPAIHADPARIISDNADNAQVTEALSHLTERQQFILQMFYVEEYNNREIAQAMGVSEAYISKTRHAALDRIAALISEAGGAREENP